MAAVTNIDTTGIHSLEDLLTNLRNRKIQVLIHHIHHIHTYIHTYIHTSLASSTCDCSSKYVVEKLTGCFFDGMQCNANANANAAGDGEPRDRGGTEAE